MNKCRAFLLFVLLSLPSMALASTNIWSFKVGFGLISSPALSPDGTLYLGSGDHKLYAVSTNLYIKWAFETGLQIKSSPSIADDGTIYVGSRDRKFYAITPEGKLKWSFTTEGWVDSSAGIAPDGTIYFGSWDHNFYALNPGGAKKWIFPTPGIIESSPAIAADGTIYFGSHDKKLYALKPDGTKKWEFATGGPITSSPAIDYSGNIYFSSVDGNFYVLNPDGSLRWKVQTGGITESSPVIDNDGNIRICINHGRGGITRDGKLLPLINVESLQDTTPIAAADGRTFYATMDATLTALDAHGEPGWQRWLEIPCTATPLLAPNGMIYAPTWLGYLKVVEIGTTPANSPWPMFRANLRHTGVVNATQQR